MLIIDIILACDLSFKCIFFPTKTMEIIIIKSVLLFLTHHASITKYDVFGDNGLFLFVA